MSDGFDEEGNEFMPIPKLYEVNNINEGYFNGCAYTLAYLIKNHKDEEVVQFISEIYHNGLVHQARVDRKKVEKLRWFSVEGHECAAVDFQELLDALAAVAPEEKE
jgi:hypothetical protein